METYSQLDLARDLDYITDSDINDIKSRGIELLRLLASLKRSYLS